jgi:hypothetical protein
MEIELLFKTYLLFGALVIVLAWFKNRSILEFLGYSLLLSPVLVFLWLLFSKTLEVFTYEGERNLSNESYKIYLTKQYHIEWIETISKYQCFGRTFETADSALKYAFNVDRGLPPDAELSGSLDQSTDTNLKNGKKNPKNSQSKTKNSSSNGAFTLIFIFAIVCAVVYIQNKGLLSDKPIFDFSVKSEISTLENADVSNSISLDGELASAFNLNSKFTDVQRDNLLKKIKGKVVVWDVEVYEVKKIGNKEYQIVTPTGFSGFHHDASLLVSLQVKDDNEKNFIESVKTGTRIKIKGVLTGDSVMRSLVVSPAMLWHANEMPTSNNQDNEYKLNQLIGKQLYEYYSEFESIKGILTISKSNNTQKINKFLQNLTLYGAASTIYKLNDFIVGNNMMPHSGGIFLTFFINVKTGKVYYLKYDNCGKNETCTEVEVYGADVDSKGDYTIPNDVRTWIKTELSAEAEQKMIVVD